MPVGSRQSRPSRASRKPGSTDATVRPRKNDPKLTVRGSGSLAGQTPARLQEAGLPNEEKQRVRPLNYKIASKQTTTDKIPEEAWKGPIRKTEGREQKDAQLEKDGTLKSTVQPRGRRRRQPTRTPQQTPQRVLERDENGTDCKKIGKANSHCASRGLQLQSTTTARYNAGALPEVVKQEENEGENDEEGYSDEEIQKENSTQEKRLVQNSKEVKARSQLTKLGSSSLTNTDIIAINKELVALKVGSLSKIDISEKAKFVNEVVEKEIISRICEIDDRFTFDILHAGSYYEHLKVGEADEFDIMVQLNAVKLSQIFKPHFCPVRRHSRHLVGFTYLEYQSHYDGHKIWRDLLEGPHSKPVLSPGLILQHFKGLLSQRLSQINRAGKQRWRRYSEPCLNGPAVKLTFCLANDKTLDIDVVLCIQSQQWPPIANNWGVLHSLKWPGTQEVEKIKLKGCHVVPKVNPSDQTCWRLSFSLAEKDLLSRKAIGEDKKHYKIVKLIFEKYKESLEPLCSYHLKTLFLWLRSDGNWTGKQTLFEVIEYFIQKLLDKVRMKELPHFFIGHDLNLFSGLSDAQVVGITTCLTKLFKDKSSVLKLVGELGKQ